MNNSQRAVVEIVQLHRCLAFYPSRYDICYVHSASVRKLNLYLENHNLRVCVKKIIESELMLVTRISCLVTSREENCCERALRAYQQSFSHTLDTTTCIRILYAISGFVHIRAHHAFVQIINARVAKPRYLPSNPGCSKCVSYSVQKKQLTIVRDGFRPIGMLALKRRFSLRARLLTIDPHIVHRMKPLKSDFQAWPKSSK